MDTKIYLLQKIWEYFMFFEAFIQLFRKCFRLWYNRMWFVEDNVNNTPDVIKQISNYQLSRTSTVLTCHCFSPRVDSSLNKEGGFQMFVGVDLVCRNRYICFYRGCGLLSIFWGVSWLLKLYIQWILLVYKG